jgi:hypothetical protein
MSRRILVWLALACGVAVAAAEEIKPVYSWAHFRDVLRSDGKTEAEIDAVVESSLAELRTMDRLPAATASAAPRPSSSSMPGSTPLH